LLRFRRSRS